MIYIRIPIKFISCYWPPTIHLLKHLFTFSPESWSVINPACLWMDPWSTIDHAMLRPYPTQLSGSNPYKDPPSFSRKFTFQIYKTHPIFHRWQSAKNSHTFQLEFFIWNKITMIEDWMFRFYCWYNQFSIYLLWSYENLIHQYNKLRVLYNTSVSGLYKIWDGTINTTTNIWTYYRGVVQSRAVYILTS